MKNTAEIKKYAESQYKTNSLLQSRINIWQYGLNQVPITKWIFSQFNFPKDGQILELGAGTGKLWMDNLENMPEMASIVLSDSSEGMVETLRQNLAKESKMFSFSQINAQNIPFPDSTFDAIIACHMLYHVPDLDGALTDICRTLKPNGLLYATTIYEDHLKEIYQILSEFNIERISSNHSDFHMLTGLSKLKTKFDRVQIKNYSNKVIITEANLETLMVYLRSSFTPEFYPNYSSVETQIKQVIQDEIDVKGKFAFTGKSGMLIATKK